MPLLSKSNLEKEFLTSSIDILRSVPATPKKFIEKPNSLINKKLGIYSAFE
jgi:hypothetical protein